MRNETKIIDLLLIISLITLIYLPLAYAQPSLRSSDDVIWSVNTENGYMVYSREIDQSRNMPIYVDIINLDGKSLTLGWKQDAKYPGMFGNMKFTTNGSAVQSIQTNESNFRDIGPYMIDNSTNYRFELSFKKGGKVWIRFPLTDSNAHPPDNNATLNQGKPVACAKQPTLEEPTILAKPTIFFVDSDAELHEAINNSSENKLIYLKDTEFNGQYYINKSNIKITSQRNNQGMPTLNGNDKEFVIAIEDASRVSIDGLMITNAYVGILLEDTANCSITNCTIKNFDLDGISMNNSSGTFIKDNRIISLNSPKHDNLTGINLTKCKDDCELSNNTIRLDGGNDSPIPIAILLDRSHGNILSLKPERGEEYLIFEDEVDWAIKCDGSYPCCRRSGDVNCDCSTFALLSQNQWDLCGCGNE